MLQTDSLAFRTLATLVLTVILIAAMRLGKPLLVPVFGAAFIAILLRLPVNALKRRGVPRPLGALILTIIIGGLLVLLGVFTIGPAQNLIETYPQMLRDLLNQISSIQPSTFLADDMGGGASGAQSGEALSAPSGESAAGSAAGTATDPSEQRGDMLTGLGTSLDETFEDPPISQMLSGLQSWALGAVSLLVQSTTSLVTTLTICGFILAIRQPFLVFATLPYRDPAAKLRAGRVWKEVEDHVSYYFLITTLINASLGTVLGLALWAIGVPSPILWGVLIAFLNYMPFVGPIIGSLSLLVVSLVQQDSALMILAPAAIYIVINFIEANFITPNVLGQKTKIQPLAIILSLFFWGWLWGFVGLIISVPFLVALNAVAQKIDRLDFIRRILEPRAAL